MKCKLCKGDVSETIIYFNYDSLIKHTVMCQKCGFHTMLVQNEPEFDKKKTWKLHKENMMKEVKRRKAIEDVKKAREEEFDHKIIGRCAYCKKSLTRKDRIIENDNYFCSEVCQNSFEEAETKAPEGIELRVGLLEGIVEDNHQDIKTLQKKVEALENRLDNLRFCDECKCLFDRRKPISCGCDRGY